MSRALRCGLRPAFKPAASASRRSEALAQVPAKIPADSDQISRKIVLQPRLCTLRSYGTEPIAVVKRGVDGDDTASESSSETSPFFEVLSDYIESSKKSQDFEIISGRLAMIVFAATVTSEIVTGNSVFRKADLAGIEEAAVVSLAAVTLAATFAWFSSARNRVGKIFTVNCNSFIDAVIDQIVDGLFYDNESGGDWSDDV